MIDLVVPCEYKRKTVYIGRFEPFHNGHAKVLRRAIEVSDFVVVLVGSVHEARSLKNPFTFVERAGMIRDWVEDISPSCEVHILPLPDCPLSHNDWIESVKKTVALASCVEYGIDDRPERVFLTGADRDDSTWYLSAFPEYSQDLVSTSTDTLLKNLSATKVRKAIFEAHNLVASRALFEHSVPPSTWEAINRFARTAVFATLREEYHACQASKQRWASSPYPPVFLTADAVIAHVENGVTNILLIERAKAPGKGLVAFPGGYLDQKEQLIECAIREAIEETGISFGTYEETRQVILNGYIDCMILDVPDRDNRGRTVSVASLFVISGPLPTVKGMTVPEGEDGAGTVETMEAGWVELKKAIENTDIWFADHRTIALWTEQTLALRKIS